MVRLKAGRKSGGYCYREFQFLMVRLKEAQSKVDAASVAVFQFLMVRLKGCPAGRTILLWSISIPYGSIKSAIAGAFTGTQLGISIPYGSIKSLRKKTSSCSSE